MKRPQDITLGHTWKTSSDELTTELQRGLALIEQIMETGAKEASLREFSN